MNQIISPTLQTYYQNFLGKAAKTISFILLFIIAQLPLPAIAASLPASELSLWWCVPFVGTLLSIALCPLFLPQLWHHHTGKIIIIWVLLLIFPLCMQYGLEICIHNILHALINEYIPFMLLLLALYTIAGGIVIGVKNSGSVRLNIVLLALGTFLAGIMGTTGATMLLIRPLLRANSGRRHCAHVVIFFILLVGNIGGGLTPLGDPPLFLGFLQGVGFIWTIQHMLLPVLFNSMVLLIIFYLIDRHYWCRDAAVQKITMQTEPIVWQIQGKLNLLLLMAVVAIVLFTGLWDNYTAWSFYGIELSLVALTRDSLLALIIVLSLLSTSSIQHQKNQFNWAPMHEVGKLFVGIFITITPVMLMLQAGTTGYFHALVNLLHQQGEPVNTLYFWMSGLLSAFLDNAPTYLVFFNLASGDAQILMDQFSTTLLAISMGSVFMGALSYIGNAPNLMVKAIAEQQQVQMPSFFAYMVWSFSLLIPLLVLNTLLFF